MSISNSMINVLIIFILVLLAMIVSPGLQLLIQTLSLFCNSTSTMGNSYLQTWLLGCWCCSLLWYSDLPSQFCWLLLCCLLVLLVDVLVVQWGLWYCQVLGFWWGFAVVVSGVCVSLSHLVRCHTSTHSSYNVACSASACVGDHFRLDGKDRLE